MSLQIRRRGAAAVLGVAAVTGVLTGCTGGTNAVDQSAGGQYRYVQATRHGALIPVAQRKPAGNLGGELLSGGNYTLSQDSGKVVVLNFFASWCAPCQVETPEFDSIYRQRKSAGVQFVGLDVKDPSKSASLAWVQDKKVSFPVIYDETAKTALQLGDVPIAGLPATVLVDRKGKVAAVYTGAMLSTDLEPVLDRLEAEA